MILTAAIGWMAQTVRGEVMNKLCQTVEDARHVGLDKKDLLMEVRRPGAALVSDLPEAEQSGAGAPHSHLQIQKSPCFREDFWGRMRYP